MTVLDADGRKTCAATVTVSNNGGGQFELTSCYYAALTDGRWTLRASLPGFADAVSTVEVDHAHDCIRHVQTVQLTLNRTGARLAPKPVLSPPPAVALPPLATPPAPAPAPAPATTSTVPEAAPAAPGSAAPPSAASSVTPPVGVFPDH
ncbi:MAG: hypothetical protein WDO74_06320 [Pseudomonadota bacterium]